MLRTAAVLTKTLNPIKTGNAFIQRRQLCSAIKKINPVVGDIYAKLLEQSSAKAPVECNFVTQVIDCWSSEANKLAIKCIEQDSGEHTNITYADLTRNSSQIADFLLDKGFKKSDKVALVLGQHPVWWYSLAGLMRVGIAAVPCPRLLTSNDLLYRINDLGISGIITTAEQQSRVDAIRDQCPTLKVLVTTGTASNGWHSIDDICGNKNINKQAEIVTTTDDACLYLYTSGTTGQPKAVQHNADYPFFHWPTGKRWLRATANDLIYNASDTGWGFTVWITTAAYAMGAALLITPTNKKFSAKQMLSTLQQHPVTIFCAAPTVLRLLVADPDFDNFNFSALRRIVTVGEALDETVINRFAAKGIEVAVGFGQAETPLLMGRVDDQLHIPGTMGRPIDPYKVVILDDAFKPLLPGNIGQIAVDLFAGKSAGIMRGYANSPEKTKNSRSPDGNYYLTGDWAEYRNDGLFAYQGRKDDLIKSSGYRIGPDEVEKAGMSHPAIAKIAVVGIKTSKDSFATTVKAYILLKPGYIESPELVAEIQAHIKQETGPYKYPRLVECLSLEEWSKYETTSGKIRRAGLRER